MKKVLDWCGNVGLGLVALLNFVLACLATNVATMVVYTLVGLAFGVAAFIFIRYTIQSSAARSNPSTKADEK